MKLQTAVVFPDGIQQKDEKNRKQIVMTKKKKKSATKFEMWSDAHQLVEP